MYSEWEHLDMLKGNTECLGRVGRCWACISTVFTLTIRLEKVAITIASGSHRVIAGHRELDRALEDEDGGRRGGEEGEEEDRGGWEKIDGGGRGQLHYCTAFNVQYERSMPTRTVCTSIQ